MNFVQDLDYDEYDSNYLDFDQLESNQKVLKKSEGRRKVPQIIEELSESESASPSLYQSKFSYYSIKEYVQKIKRKRPDLQKWLMVRMGIAAACFFTTISLYYAIFYPKEGLEILKSIGNYCYNHPWEFLILVALKILCKFVGFKFIVRFVRYSLLRGLCCCCKRCFPNVEESEYTNVTT